MDTTPQHTNRLSRETSPYLRQHAHNPVDWFAWGPEALARAKKENKPIFLSVGYSACHWCHVMEHESFEDEETGKVLNEHFISIKVDREERPDLDQIYMNAVTALTGHGGWPMSVFLTPDLRPFYGGTYFPPDDRHGMPSFRRVLLSIAQAWQERQDQVVESAAQITNHLQQATHLERGEGALTADLIRKAVSMLERIHDPRHGGFGNAPKFPHALELKLLLRAWKRFSDDTPLQMARLTLDRMAMGGMYDHLAGGFHRYTTDARWLVPHFEKMLYDNALLSQAYLEAYQATGDTFYREIVEETLGWVQAEMTSPEGAFYSTLDADTEGVEGKYYVWSLKEVEQVVGPELAEAFTYVYDVSESGNWEGHNILNRSKSYGQDAKLLRLPEDELRTKLTAAKRKLLEARSQRVRPGRDEKVLTSWNGLMIAAFAQAAQVLDQRYVEPARRAADFLLKAMRGADGRLLRTHSTGSPAKLNAYLEDYAFLIDALVSLYEAGFEERWLAAAVELMEILIDQFWDQHGGGFFYTGRDHEALIVRNKDPHDSSIPSGNSMAVLSLLRLARLTGRVDLEEKAAQTLQLFQGLMAQVPTASGQMLVALDFFLGPVQEFAVLGPGSAAGTRQALRLIQSGFRPNKVVAFKDLESTPGSAQRLEKLVPLLAGKTAQSGEVATYICEHFACQAPVTGIDELEKALEAAAHSPATSFKTSSET